ncbi:TPA: hypothetical protein AB5H75_004040 [Vibrio mimicus]|uniref:hypothetical protein n=1 Tax=Vibrio mimicus TaxID=674 RepID=UPI0011D86E92|nr:hypothetical protein [Vibrio mimicus]TXZ06879.1 hypothetical protein FXE63_14280 [Vibrio mimicus]TXZ74357.1 hypothetical protein FXE51_15790 [Vibrio mimicus]
MSQYLIEPEVPGGFGENTLGRFDVHPPIVEKLHLEFDGWLGDDLLERFPCFLVTERLATALSSSQLSGYNLEVAEISTSDVFEELYPECTLPRFSWLQVSGTIGKDDFSVTNDGLLLVSERAMVLLQRYQLENSDIVVYKS